MKPAHRLFAASLLTACIVVPAVLQAQVERSGGGELQKIMQQYQQVAAEKTALQSQLAQAKKDLDAANTELAEVKKERDAAKAHVGVPPAALAAANAAKNSAEQGLEKSKQQITEIVGKYRELAASLRDVEADRTKISKELTERNNAFDQCALDNLQLYEINGEILDRYDHVGLFTKTSASEPFTRLTRTRIDNLVIEYREKAEQLRVKKAPTKSP
jgi:chromosome segregation ATPase